MFTQLYLAIVAATRSKAPSNVASASTSWCLGVCLAAADIPCHHILRLSQVLRHNDEVGERVRITRTWTETPAVGSRLRSIRHSASSPPQLFNNIGEGPCLSESSS